MAVVELNFSSPSLRYDYFRYRGRRQFGRSYKNRENVDGISQYNDPDHPTPVVDISFRDYRANDGSFVSIIDKEHFFTTEEFELADHHFQGQFDEFGQFKGLVKIYGEKHLITL